MLVSRYYKFYFSQTLLEIFDKLDTVLRFLNNRGEKAVWTNVRESVKNLTKK